MKCLVLIFLYVFSSCTAHAEFIASLTGQSSLQPDGTTVYTYTVDVSPSSTLSVAGFNILVSPAADITSIGDLPIGWDVYYNTGNPIIGWGASEFAPLLLPGSKTVFSLSSPLPPSRQAYFLDGADDSGQFYDEISGDIVAPGALSTSSIPGPPGWVLFVVGSLVVIVAQFFKSLYR